MIVEQNLTWKTMKQHVQCLENRSGFYENYYEEMI
jgi:hypothetical protein